MNIFPLSNVCCSPQLVAPSGLGDRTRDEVQRAADRAYREMVEEQPRLEILRNLCRGIAECFSIPLVALLRRHDCGTLELEATSRETMLWAELLRLPERCDGTIAGRGPGSRALAIGDTVVVGIDDEGFMPWRDAATRDGIVSVWARPVEVEGQGWVLILCTSRTPPDGGVDAAQIRMATSACGRVIAAIDRLDRRRMLASALSHAGTAAFIADVEGRITWCNTSFCELTSYAREEVIGRNPRFLSSGRHGVRRYRDLWDTIRRGEVWRGETVDRDRSGAAFTAMQTISPFGADGRVTHYLALYENISQKKAEDVRRELRSKRDVLTGLMPRAALEHELAERLAQHQAVAIGVVAVRRLAAIEGLGSEALDVFFGEMHLRLSAVVGSKRAARLSAGEYLVVLPDDAEQADAIVASLMKDLLEPYPLIGDLPGADLRIGRARSPEDGSSVETLLLAADRALARHTILPAHREQMVAAD